LRAVTVVKTESVWKEVVTTSPSTVVSVTTPAGKVIERVRVGGAVVRSQASNWATQKQYSPGSVVKPV
jgi:membrane carboxypeptidase/penicillin-binding protein